MDRLRHIINWWKISLMDKVQWHVNFVKSDLTNNIIYVESTIQVLANMKERFS